MTSAERKEDLKKKLHKKMKNKKDQSKRSNNDKNILYGKKEKKSEKDQEKKGTNDLVTEKETNEQNLKELENGIEETKDKKRDKKEENKIEKKKKGGPKHLMKNMKSHMRKIPGLKGLFIQLLDNPHIEYSKVVEELKLNKEDEKTTELFIKELKDNILSNQGAGGKIKDLIESWFPKPAEPPDDIKKTLEIQKLSETRKCKLICREMEIKTISNENGENVIMLPNDKLVRGYQLVGFKSMRMPTLIIKDATFQHKYNITYELMTKMKMRQNTISFSNIRNFIRKNEDKKYDNLLDLESHIVRNHASAYAFDITNEEHDSCIFSPRFQLLLDFGKKKVKSIKLAEYCYENEEKEEKKI